MENLIPVIAEKLDIEIGKKFYLKITRANGDENKDIYVLYYDGFHKIEDNNVSTVCNTELETKDYTIELTNSQKNAVIRAYEEENFWHVSRDYLINVVLVGFDYFSVEDATFAVDHMDVDFDEQAILYVKQNSSGQSRGGITEMMRYYGYTEAQINNALKEAGF